MPSADVRWPGPLTRLPPWMPGQTGGVEGTGHDTGLRLHTTGKVVWVDPNYPGVWDAAGNAVDRDGTEPTDPCATVALALSKCRPYRGDTIAVMANGFWTDAPKGAANQPLPITETVEVTVHGVRIVGVFPSSPLGVPWRGVAAGDTILTVSAMDVLVEGFCFMGESAAGGANCDGIYVEWDGSPLWGDCVTVRNCFFDYEIETAIELEFVYNADIHHNVFQGCNIAGIYSDGVPAIRDCHFHHNWFMRVGEGETGAISVVNAARCKIDHNQVYNSDAQQGGAPLIATDEGIDTSGGGQNLVHDNVLSCLLPGPGNDYSDFCNSGATDAWCNNTCMNGVTTTNP